MREEEERRKKMTFFGSLFLSSYVLKAIVCKYFFELLGFIILSACLVWGLYLFGHYPGNT